MASSKIRLEDLGEPIKHLLYGRKLAPGLTSRPLACISTVTGSSSILVFGGVFFSTSVCFGTVEQGGVETPMEPTVNALP